MKAAASKILAVSVLLGLGSSVQSLPTTSTHFINDTISGAYDEPVQWDHFNEADHYTKTVNTFDFDEGDGRGKPGMPGWVDPRDRGGSMLDLVGNGLREPINAVISGHSDPQILSESGLRDYVRTIGFSFECLDLHIGGLQRADLGDGNGWITEQFEYRETEPWEAPGRWVGACWESLYGGNHFRVWKQNGTHADTGAWFLAVSKEKNLRHHHTIDTNGYNHGRNLLVEAAIAGGRWKIWKWKARVTWADDLLDAGKRGINHEIEQDGRVAILTVDRVIDIPFFPDFWIRSTLFKSLFDSHLTTLSHIVDQTVQLLLLPRV